MATAARLPAAELNQHPPSPFTASLCLRPEVPGSGGGGRRREPLRRGAVSARLPVPDHIPRPPYVGTDAMPDVCPDRQVHDGESVMRMLDACELAARVLQYAGTLPSVTTDEIDRAVHQMIIDAGAYPSPLGYGGFPKSVCTSVNECTCHGIPNSRELQDGDIINIDVTVYLNGYHGDTSRTYLCGDVDESTKQLVKPTLSMGSTQCVLWDDGWTAVAVDGSLSAQFEHTVLVTRDGVEVLTGCP
nr:unnamed protein product [Digitaria exilis]